MQPIQDADESECEQKDFPAQYSPPELEHVASLIANGSRRWPFDLQLDLLRLGRRAQPNIERRGHVACCASRAIQRDVLPAGYLQVPARAVVLQTRARLHWRDVPAMSEILSP
jgi:hypothetical protein